LLGRADFLQIILFLTISARFDISTSSITAGSTRYVNKKFQHLNP
jgi:hypothetical protein